MPTTSPGGGQRRRAGDPGDPEVHQLGAAPGAAVVADDHVLGLDVAVDDAAGVGVGERVAEVGADLGDVAVGEHPGGRRRLGEGLARDQLGDEDGVAGVLAELVEGDDRRVVEPRRRLGLAQDAVGIGGLDLLQRDLALEALVVGAVDGAHSARSRSARARGSGPSPGSCTTTSTRSPVKRRSPAGAVAPGQGSYSARRKATWVQWLSSTRTNYNRPDPAPGPGGRGPSASASWCCAG